jgi:hypothetical protein
VLPTVQAGVEAASSHAMRSHLQLELGTLRWPGASSSTSMDGPAHRRRGGGGVDATGRE